MVSPAAAQIHAPSFRTIHHTFPAESQLMIVRQEVVAIWYRRSGSSINFRSR